MTWRLHIETIEAKGFRTFIRLYPLFKSEQLSVNIKLTLHKALIKSAMTYTCPAWEFAAPLAISRGAHWSAICMWLSKFCMFTIT
jgi:hypothetical protein